MWRPGLEKIRDLKEVDLRGGYLLQLELFGEFAELNLYNLKTRYQGPGAPSFTEYRQDARLRLSGVSETTVSGRLTWEDPIASATLMDADQQTISWLATLRGAVTASLELKLASGVTIAHRCSYVTLRLES